MCICIEQWSNYTFINNTKNRLVQSKWVRVQWRTKEIQCGRNACAPWPDTSFQWPPIPHTRLATNGWNVRWTIPLIVVLGEFHKSDAGAMFVVVMSVRIIFISLFFFYCLLWNRSFLRNPNSLYKKRCCEQM